ncbi:flagellar hook protein FlgE [Oscillibacter valericigenes Sjm18-20]|nr:flagellar hook protein FlgE [Oscillibacter valericigenes Sjm18-20]
MTGAMYAAISGMKAHMQKLNVIGNNIANINTPAFKASQTTFKESIYTTITSGSNGSSSAGGINPSQLGYGCNVGTIAMDMSTASFSADGNNMHCMIDGSGFFLTGDKATATTSDSKTTLNDVDPQDLDLSRVGDFTFDSQGYLVDGQGHVIYGFVTYTANTDGNTLKDTEKESPLVSTQLVPIRLPIAAGAPTDKTKDPDAGTALYPTQDGTSGKNIYPTGSGNAITVSSIAIDKGTGKITAVNDADNSNIVVGYLALGTVANPNGVTRLENGYYQAGEGAGNCTATSIGGTVTGFLNKPADATTGDAILSSGKTALQTGGLESSGTDLATEIAEMITTQRGYQANTRIITVTDSMLEEMVNMKR